jgi:hypothetical protein
MIEIQLKFDGIHRGIIAALPARNVFDADTPQILDYI